MGKRSERAGAKSTFQHYTRKHEAEFQGVIEDPPRGVKICLLLVSALIMTPLKSGIFTRLILSINSARIITHLIAWSLVTIVCVGIGAVFVYVAKLPLGESIGYSITLLGILYGTYYWISSQSKTNDLQKTSLCIRSKLNGAKIEKS